MARPNESPQRAPRRTLRAGVSSLVGIALALTACGDGDKPIIKIDGSSTVYPITEAVSEEFGKQAEARITIGVSGTGGGFKKFCQGETAITGASRPIKPSEVELCGEHDIPYVEVPVAFDGIAVVVHPDNTWVDHLTVAELNTIWAPGAQNTITSWSQVRAGFPDKPLRLFGAGVDSGTYDYFTKAIVGKEHSSRGDFTSAEDDNVLVVGVSRDTGSLGFFGFAYYAENKDKLKLVPVKAGDAAPVQPSVQTVADGSYQPLSRPIFIYITSEAAARPEVTAFITYWMTHGAPLVEEVGYIPLPAATYKLALDRFTKRIPGSVFKGKGAQVGVNIEQLLGDGR